MSLNLFTEDQLVEQPAIGLVAELGWDIACGNPHPGPIPAGEGVGSGETGVLGRETKGKVVKIKDS